MYLGIPQPNGNLVMAKKSATAKYLQGVRLVLRSQLNRKNKIQATNSYAVSHQKALHNVWGGFHLKSSTLRLYMKRTRMA